MSESYDRIGSAGSDKLCQDGVVVGWGGGCSAENKDQLKIELINILKTHDSGENTLDHHDLHFCFDLKADLEFKLGFDLGLA